MTSTLRPLRLAGAAVALALAACVDAPPTAVAPSPESAALQARLAAEQHRIDSIAAVQAAALAGRGPVAVASSGLLGGVLGTTTGLLTGVVNGLTYTLLKCDLLPYAASTRIIGPAGGTITAGRATLVVPAGALAAPTVITAEQPRGTSAEVDFSPHGLRFAAPASLTIGYAGCLDLSGYRRGIVYVDESGAIVEAPPSVDFPAADRVTAGIGHFSGYVIAHTRETY